MSENEKTLYEVLGIPRDAKVTDVGRAYNRIRANMQKEDAAPDPRLLAAAKVAYDTLSDPQLREEYDSSLEPEERKHVLLISLAAALALFVAAGGYYFFSSRAAKNAAPTVGNEELLQTAGAEVGRVRMALVSGEVRELGLAVSVAEGEMATTCRGFTAGAQLTVKVVQVIAKADLLRANEDLDVCTLTVRSAAARVKLRPGSLASNEAVTAIVLGASAIPQVREGSVARFVEDPKGSLVELKFPAPLENGTPIFDSQGRLAAIVTSANAHGARPILAIPSARIIEARKRAPR
jgi:hypothetical protein